MVNQGSSKIRLLLSLLTDHAAFHDPERAAVAYLFIQVTAMDVALNIGRAETRCEGDFILCATC